MFGLTILGIFHTVISLIAVVCGAISLVKYHEISSKSIVGKIYIYTTIIVCITGFGIFQHGGFGVAHALGIVTLIVLAIAIVTAQINSLFGMLSPYISTIAFSMTFLFHLIPAINETMTRLPYGNPIAISPEDPIIKPFIGICFLLFIVGAVFQVIDIKKKKKQENL